MANPDRATVIQSLSTGPNAALFLQVYGPSSFDDVDTAYDNLAGAIGAYERSPDLSPFSSKL